MSDFCENPFCKDTPVTIFSQGSEADDWINKNCCRCDKHLKCDLQHAIFHTESDFYCVVPLHIAKRIGISYNPLYQQGSVYSQCSEFNDGYNPF